MKCYVCGYMLEKCIIEINNKKITAHRCPKCNDDYTTIIKEKDLKESDI